MGAKHDRGSHLERLKRRAFDEVPGQATTGRDAAVVDSDFDDEDDEDGGDEGSEYYKAERTAEARRRRKQIKAYEKRYKQLDRGGHVLQGGWGAEGAAVPDEDSDMQDNIYLWRPEGVEESAVQDAAFEALQGDWGAGLAKLEDEVRAAPNNTEALNYLATALLSQPTPDTTRAAELLERAVECEPGNLALVGNLASVLAEAHGFTSPVAPEVAALPVMTRVEQVSARRGRARPTHAHIHMYTCAGAHSAASRTRRHTTDSRVFNADSHRAALPAGAERAQDARADAQQLRHLPEQCAWRPCRGRAAAAPGNQCGSLQYRVAWHLCAAPHRYEITGPSL